MSFSSICKYLQVLASRSQAFSMHSQENEKKSKPICFIRNGFAEIRKNFASIHKASLFSVFLQANLIIFGKFATKFKFSYSQGYSSQCERGINKLSFQLTAQENLRIKIRFFDIHLAMKLVGRAKIP